jgi:rubrerythrin
MATARVETDPPGGATVDVCLTCNLIWLTSNARAEIPERLSPNRAEALEEMEGHPLIQPPEQCPDCGAPWALDDDLRCKYCGHQLLAAAPG